MRIESKPNNLPNKKTKHFVRMQQSTLHTSTQFQTKLKTRLFGRWDNNRCKPENKTLSSTHETGKIASAKCLGYATHEAITTSTN